MRLVVWKALEISKPPAVWNTLEIALKQRAVCDESQTVLNSLIVWKRSESALKKMETVFGEEFVATCNTKDDVEMQLVKETVWQQ